MQSDFTFEIYGEFFFFFSALISLKGKKNLTLARFSPVLLFPLIIKRSDLLVKEEYLGIAKACLLINISSFLKNKSNKKFQ